MSELNLTLQQQTVLRTRVSGAICGHLVQGKGACGLNAPSTDALVIHNRSI